MDLAKKRRPKKKQPRSIKQKTKQKISTSESKNSATPFPIIGIGASAGGLEAMEKFFSNIPAKTGMAYIVITHLDREHISVMSELLNKYTPMPVSTIMNGARVKPNNIYVIPPRKNVEIKNGILKLIEQNEPHYSNLPINYFFQSLATDRAENAVGLVLSGAGTDGTVGARDIKLHGGIIIAQDPTTAKFNSMPTSIIDSGLVDFILAPEQMPEQLLRWAHYGEMKDGKISLELQQIFTLIRAKTTYDFSQYKLNTIYRRIEKQMHIHHLEKLSDYLNLLRQNPNEVEKLFKSLLIGVTRFFRDPEAFQELKNSILPQIFKKKPLDYCIRVWVPGCSTGEEVYSIAITIAEYMQESGLDYYVQIFGTDIDRDALATSRTGVYPESIEQEVNAQRLKRFFTKEKNSYKIKKEIRSMVIFGEQNLIKDPPFTKVDLISCRNLLIYLNVKLQKSILPIFHYSLKPKGILFLGMSESIAGCTELFHLNNKKAKFFERKNTSTPYARRLLSEVSPFNGAELNVIQENKLINENRDIYVEFKKYLLNKLISPCLLINKNGDIVYWIGKLNHYLKHTQHLENMNIFDIAHHNIKNTIKSVLHMVISKHKEVTYHNLPIEQHNEISSINLRAIPLNEIALLHDMILIIFDESSQQFLLNAPSHLSHATKKNKFILKLEDELRYTKENLQATIEEMESSNEELQSMNEELQSTNEELETSKEELHSLNEELVSMNTELQNKIDQLATVHDDMTNLFNSTEIATLFLDNNLCIKQFTPKAVDLIHLIPNDIGRSIRHFATNILYEKLTEDAEEVLRTLNQKTIEVRSKSDQWFLIRILPYRTLTNMIDGVVITFTDITEHKTAEKRNHELNAALQNALACSRNIIDTVAVPLLVLSAELKIISANRAVYKNFHLLPEDIIGKFIYKVNGWNSPELKNFLEQDFPADVLFEGFEAEIAQARNKNQKIVINARKILNNDLGADVILVAMEPK